MFRFRGSYPLTPRLQGKGREGSGVEWTSIYMEEQCSVLFVVGHWFLVMILLGRKCCRSAEWQYSNYDMSD